VKEEIPEEVSLVVKKELEKKQKKKKPAAAWDGWKVLLEKKLDDDGIVIPE
jgi:hypothetical protein